MTRIPVYRATGYTTRAATLVAGTNMTITETTVGGTAQITFDATGGGGGGGAPTNAKYLTLGTDATLTQERVFAPSARFSYVDGGAGASYALDLNVSGVTAGSYTNASITVDTYGRVTAASSGTAGVTSVSGTTGRVTSTGGTTPVIDLATAGTAGTYAYPTSMTTDAYGRVTSVTAGSAPVASTVTVDAGELTNTGTPTAAVLGLANAGTAGTYTYPTNIQTDAFGRVVAVSSGIAPVTAHNGLTNLDWVNSGHTGVAYGVAAWNAAGAATVVNATADETMLVRRGGTLQWVPLVASVVFFSGDFVDDGTILYPNGIEIYAGSIV